MFEALIAFLGLFLGFVNVEPSVEEVDLGTSSGETPLPRAKGHIVI